MLILNLSIDLSDDLTIPLALKLMPCQQKPHGYNTRNKNIPNISKHDNTQYNKIFIVRAAICWLQLTNVFKHKFV